MRASELINRRTCMEGKHNDGRRHSFNMLPKSDVSEDIFVLGVYLVTLNSSMSASINFTVSGRVKDFQVWGNFYRSFESKIPSEEKILKL